MTSSTNHSPSSFSSFDADLYKIAQRQSWDSAASGWKKWWEVTEKGAQKINNRLVELAEIKPGQKILDFATGIGEPAVTGSKGGWYYRRSCLGYRYFTTNARNCERKDSIFRITRHNRV